MNTRTRTLTEQARETVRRTVSRGRHRLLRARMLESAAVGATAAGFCAAACLLILELVARLHIGDGLYAGLPLTVTLAPGFLVAGAIIGATTAWVRGVSWLGAAAWLDRRAGMEQLLLTAAELASSDAPGRCEAQAVWRQAARACEARGLHRVSPWRRSRRTLAALGLAVLLCLTIAMIPSRTAGGSSRATRLAEAIGNASAADRNAIAARLRQAGAKTSGRAALETAFTRAAEAVEAQNPRLLADQLSHLIAEHADLASLLPEQVLSAAERGAAPEGSGAAGAGDHAAQEGPTHAAADAGMIRIYNPGEPTPSRGPGSASPKVIEGPMAAAASENLDDAWAAAKERAAAGLASGTTPLECRSLVRDFFLAD